MVTMISICDVYYKASVSILGCGFSVVIHTYITHVNGVILMYFQIHFIYLYFITSDSTARVRGAIYWLGAGHPKITLAKLVLVSV